MSAALSMPAGGTPTRAPAGATLELSGIQAGYGDFQKGDQIAAYGGLGVLAAVLGVKFGKVATIGLPAGLALLLKKGAFLIIVPLLALGGFIKRLFRRDRASS